MDLAAIVFKTKIANIEGEINSINTNVINTCNIIR